MKEFTKATYNGEQWVKEHTAREIAEKIQEFFPDTTLASLENSVQKYKDIDAWRDTPVLKESAFDKLQELCQRQESLQRKHHMIKLLIIHLQKKYHRNICSYFSLLIYL